MLLLERRSEAWRYYSAISAELASLQCTCSAENFASTAKVCWEADFSDGCDSLYPHLKSITTHRDFYAEIGCDCQMLETLRSAARMLNSMCHGLCLNCVRENKETPGKGRCSKHSKGYGTQEEEEDSGSEDMD